MDDPLLSSSSRSITDLTYPEIERYIRRGAALLVPLGTTEPYGDTAPLGCCGALAQAVAERAAEQTDSLCAPLLAYGCAGGGRAFAGTTVVKPDTLAAFLAQCLHGWYAQGFRRLWLVDGGWNNGAAVDGALRRLARLDSLRGCVFSWVRDSRVRSYWATIGGGPDTARAEQAAVSMMAFLKPAWVRGTQRSAGGQQAERQWSRWRRRGQDPQLFRKLYPAATVSSEALVPDVALGGKLLTYIVETLVGDLANG
ncbi:MAG: hypothetical protein GF331_25865 [Chitinivibrionales bacterium]|nr:hypothetical protein [Chitinivibrionales bacterium]